MRDEVSDESLLAQVALADASAFATLVERHLGPLLVFIKRYVAEHSAAEDIAQEVFFRVWQHAGRWRPQAGTARGWFYRIAYNLCIDVLRRSQPVTDALNKLVSEETPEQILADSAREQYVHEAVAALPERQRTALYLCAYQGLSNMEAARILEVSVPALESLLARARRSLRSQIQAKEGKHDE